MRPRKGLIFKTLSISIAFVFKPIGNMYKVNPNEIFACLLIVAISILNRSSLIPTYAFGENDVFYQVSNPRGSMLRKIQTKIQKMVAFAPCLFYGRGIFQYTFGVLPHRKPINVVGKKRLDLVHTCMSFYCHVEVIFVVTPV